MPDTINTSIDSSSAAQETAPAIAAQPVPVTDKQDGKFKLERIDADNVRKIDSRPDLSVVNIPALEKQKADTEAEMAKLQAQLNQINEVLGEYKKLQ
ncbi:MAG: hypothetical protein B7W98_01045 [Parcubacteria group bacterium 20-58-5]|nr:MAG: hypothetical protein B7W98_01045 [Parcubacteria group bacterium 20-58-5]